MKIAAEEINKILVKVFKNQHPCLPAIILNWGKIIGYKYSQNSYPQKITLSKQKGQTINTLYIQVDNSTIDLELNYQQELILERLAVYLGLKIIHRLRFIITTM